MAEWENEPNEHSWVDERTGYDCQILRVEGMGHLCGYVRIPEGHQLHNVEFNTPIVESMKPLVDVVLNGPVGKRGPMQVFLAALSDHHSVDILFDVHGGLTYSGELDGYEGFWYGFDCAHSGDLCPDMGRRGTYRNLEYVKAECASLAKQLKQLAG